MTKLSRRHNQRNLKEARLSSDKSLGSFGSDAALMIIKVQVMALAGSEVKLPRFRGVLGDLVYDGSAMATSVAAS